MELKGCAAIVTGGSGGLGQRICRALALAGVNVAVNYAASNVRAKRVAAELARLGTRAIAVKADVTDPDSVARMVEQAKAEFGRVDILVNDAAINQSVPYADLDGMTHELWNHILATNLTGTFNCIKAVAPVMKAQGQGRIVNISSGAGVFPRGSSIAYAVSKAGVIHLTKCMAVALAPAVAVNCVAPGFMEGTRMTSNLSPDYASKVTGYTLLGRPVSKDDVADQVVLFCRSDSMTGQTVVMDCGRLGS
ncbi:MAG: SDR family NAD(P)-dependent oxidoreductase [Betaproteobacteria bacterium]|nr:SDR family NAD(P)-dependent oxidoreductase [Betaproteobacteria bacterium]